MYRPWSDSVVRGRYSSTAAPAIQPRSHGLTWLASIGGGSSTWLLAAGAPFGFSPGRDKENITADPKRGRRSAENRRPELSPRPHESGQERQLQIGQLKVGNGEIVSPHDPDNRLAAAKREEKLRADGHDRAHREMEVHPGNRAPLALDDVGVRPDQVGAGVSHLGARGWTPLSGGAPRRQAERDPQRRGAAPDPSPVVSGHASECNRSGSRSPRATPGASCASVPCGA